MNNTSVFDSTLYASLFTTQEMRDLWTEKEIIQSWLDFEIALAKVEAELGIIPTEAVDAIKQAAVIDCIDWEIFVVDVEHVGMAIKPLLDQITKSSDNELVKRYLHWGSTTQDVLDTGQAIRIKKSLLLIRKQLVNLVMQLADMAELNKDTIMVARTNSQDALPTTWGLQVSGYMLELHRHIQRLDNLIPRACTGLFGGAVGNMSSLNMGDKALELRDRLMVELGLPKSIGIANASQDGVVEVVQFLALIHGSLVRIANDVELMGRSSISELREGEGGGGSSTMPNKSNPRASNMIQTLSRLGWMYAGSAPNLMDQRDVRAASMRVISWSIVPEAFLAASTSLERASRLIKHLIINKEKMRSNFNATRNFVMSEAVMMKLADKIGRDDGYKIVKTILKNYADSVSDSSSNINESSLPTTLLQDVLLQNGITKYLTEEEVLSACNPENYIGSSLGLIAESISYVKNSLANIG